MQIPNTITIPYSISWLLQSHYIEPEQPQESYVMFTIFRVLICEETVILSPKFMVTYILLSQPTRDILT